MSALGPFYLWIKALHVIAVISWMAALLYLPRLFVYHTEAEPGSTQSETFKVMERRLAKAIMTPAMLVSLATGLAMLGLNTALFQAGAFIWVKLALIVGLIGMHVVMIGWMRDFAADQNTKPQRFFRFMNEVPTLLMIGIVIMIIVRPF